MKKFILIFALASGFIFSNNENLNAQNISINVNIGNQPAWGPIGYDYVDYYYFPDFNAYFDVNSGLYIFLDRGRWITSQYLPLAYRHYDLYNVYKVALNIKNPWRYNKSHIRNYVKYKNYYGHQVVIRDSRDRRYANSRYNYRPWSPNQNVGRPQSSQRPNQNINQNNRPNNNRPNNNRPNSNNNRPNLNNNRPSTSRPNNSSSINNNGNTRPSYNVNQSQTRNNQSSSDRRSSSR